ncbi:MAG: M16 family metallopeptidase [Pirellulaceae bacterium]
MPTLLYGPGHPWGSPGEGYATTVASLTRDQVRAFYADHFTPQRSVLIAVGDVDPSTLVALLEAKFAAWQGTAGTAPAPTAPQTAAADRVFLVDKPGAVQSVIVVGRTWRGRGDDTYFATRIGNRILGGDFLSRINQNLRERNGYTYGARSGFDYGRSNSQWTVQTSVRSEVTGAALRELISELQAVTGDRPLTEEEVAIARQAESNTFPEAFETPGRIASALTQLAIFNLPDDYFAHFVDRLEATSPAEIAQAMAQLVARPAVVQLVVGDRRVVEPKLIEAGFPSVQLIDSDGQLAAP